MREVSAKELIRPIEDPSKSYPFNPKPINPYSRIPLDNRVIYGANPHKNIISYSDWDYQKKKRNFGYEGAKPFSGSYEESGGSKSSSSYAFSSPKSNSGSYSMAA